MRLAALTLATALGLGTVSMTTVGMAFGNHSGWGGNHFGHRAFGHPFHNRFRFHKTLIVPYAYYDYGYPTDAFGDYPPPVAGVVAPPSPPPMAGFVYPLRCLFKPATLYTTQEVAPGAVRYYREIGIKIPDALVPTKLIGPPSETFVLS